MRSHEVSGSATALPPDRRTRSHQRLREGSSMGQKTVRFSDLSGQLIMHDDALARIVVHEHPEHVERYGLQDLARDRNLELEFGLTDETDIEDQMDAKVA